MYVGITRAQRTLHVTWCKKRKRAGELVHCDPSRFIKEMALDVGDAAAQGNRNPLAERAPGQPEGAAGDAEAAGPLTSSHADAVVIVAPRRCSGWLSTRAATARAIALLSMYSSAAWVPSMACRIMPTSTFCAVNRSGRPASTETAEVGAGA